MKTCKTCKHWDDNVCGEITIGHDHEATPNKGILVRVHGIPDSGLMQINTGPDFSCALHYDKDDVPLKEPEYDGECSGDQLRFTIGGEWFEAIQGNGYSDCDKCVFTDLNCMAMKSRPSCSSADRDDNRDIYFKRMI